MKTITNCRQVLFVSQLGRKTLSINRAMQGIPSNILYLQVTGGSGYFEVANSNVGVADTRFLPTNQTVRVTPIADGDAQLTIRDLCLKAGRSPSEY